MRKKIGWIALLLVLTAGLVLAGCSSGGNGGNSAGNKAGEAGDTANAPANDGGDSKEETPAEPVKLRIMVPGEPDINADNDRIFAELEKRTNTKLEIISIPWDNYNDKMKVMAAGGEFPDIVTTIDLANRSLVDNWIQQGMLVPYDDKMLEAAPEIVKQYEQTKYYEELKVDGKIYFQPIYWNTVTAPNVPIHVRKDLLDKLGLQPPQTLDELYTAMKRMKDELGIYGVGLAAKNSNPMGPANAIAGAFGVQPGGWVKNENGDYVYGNVQPGMLEALKWMKRLYAEGIADPESFTLDGNADGQAETNYFTGKYGFYFGNGGGHVPRFQDNLRKNIPTAQEFVLEAPAGPDGKRGYGSGPSFWAVTAISGNAKDPVAAARFLNYLVSPEGQMLTQFGIEGVHYTKSGDTLDSIELNKEERAKEGADHWDSDRYHQLAAPYVTWVPQPVQDFFAMYGKDQSEKDWYAQMWENQLKYMTVNEIMLNTTPKWSSFTNTSNDLTNEYFNKILLSKKDDADALFAEYVSKWNKAGGEEASKEMSEAVKKLKGE